MKFSNAVITFLILIFLLFAGISQANYFKNYKADNQKIKCISGFSYEDCYIYERVFENGQWWIYVYTCDGVFVEMHLDEEE